MKYIYAYKTSDGVRHEAAMDAESREAVFAALRERGIKAIKVVAADGSKANGEVRGVRKRIVAAGIVLAALVSGTLVYLSTARQTQAVQDIGAEQHARPLARQAILGDRQRVEQARQGAFTNRVDAFLARFAEPGRRFSAPESDWPGTDETRQALARPVLIGSNEFTEQIDLKRIVAGMRCELTAYLRGGGLVSGYIRELIGRQQREIAYREGASERLDGLMKRPMTLDTRTDVLRAAYEYWLKANAQLQSMGIYPLPLPDGLREYQLAIRLEE